MNLNDVLGGGPHRPARKRVGRGHGSGNGKTAGRGHKGAKARAGWKNRYGYEGGQMSIARRLPKRGFSNSPFGRSYDVVNVAQLEQAFAAGETVDVGAIRQRLGLKCRIGKVKVLGEGELTKKLSLSVHAVSASARQKVEACGGAITVLALPRPRGRTPARADRPAKKPSGGEKRE